MLRSVAIALLLGAVGAFAPTACTSGPGRDDVEIDRLLIAIRDKGDECECSSIPWGDDRWLIGDSEALGTFDPECLDRWVQWVDELSCEAPQVPGFADLCPLYHGTGYLGMPCIDYELRFDHLLDTSCTRGLYCIEGTCRDPQVEPIGQVGHPCDVGPRCDAGAYCSDGLCTRLPTVGDPCPDDRCADDLVCFETRCTALPGVDEPCLRGECNDDAYCVFDSLGSSRCFRKASEGEPCTGHAQCASGNCPAGSCARPARAGEPCSNRLPCGEGLRCEDLTCQPVSDELGVVSACELLIEL